MRKFCATLFAWFAAAGFVVTAEAQQSLWDANGSVVFESSTGSTVRFIFQIPRRDFAAQGATAGALLLELQRNAATFSGIGYGFAAGCDPESYEVSGALSPDGKVITLKGRAPVRDATCKITSYRDQTLVVSRQAAAPPPSQVSRPQSAREQCATLQAPGGPERYCASSVLPPQAGNSYDVSNLFAGSPAQAWIEGQPGQGIGEWIVVEFAAPRKITGLLIDNGYQKSPDIFYKNSRVSSLEVRFPQGQSETLALLDRFGTQRLSLATPVVASWVQFIIRDVYPGSKYTDTAISNLSVQSEEAN